MNFFEIMKYFARAIEQMRAVDGILIPQFPWPNGLSKSNDVFNFPLMGFNKSNDELCEPKGGSKYPLMDFF